MVNAALLSSLLAFHAGAASRRASTDIAIRQADAGTTLDPSQFPSQCQTSCTTIINSLNNCDSESCICSSDNAKGMESCVNCLVSIAPDSASLQSEGKGLIDQFNTECSSFNIPSISISPSGSSSDSGSSATGSASSAPATSTSSAPLSTGGRSASTMTKTSSASESSQSSKSDSGLMGDHNAALNVKGGFAGVVVSLVAIAAAAYML
ncbi:hypothetical protein VKT23_020141 [Stygiomarasmius scandens]|uniref:Extracellular membrane protein CFEM domain-containing protein n=1 Tax=Marasmiellus scandens TaxID=2682957 RepID=A0ABR1IJQ3_9AGAR